jgi:cytochrome P450
VAAGEHALLGSWINPIAAALGTPSADARRAADDAITQFNDYVVALIDDRRRNPGDDLLSALIAAEQHGDQLSTDELAAMTAQLLFGGLETTRDLIGSAVYLLATHRAEEAKIRRDPALVQHAINETLRYEPPVTYIVRPTRRDLPLGGIDVPAGQYILMNVAAANRDPQHWDAPERFDITRRPTRVLSFGWGSHYCVGASVARMEATVAIDTLISRFQTIDLRDPAPEWRPFTVVRSLDALPIHLAP